jgi:ubiquinone/menaquinone biosynthesis C-methylase UbiE
MANLYIDSLLTADPLRRPVLREIIQAQGLPTASRGLDVGCGIGLEELLLAEAVGEGGHVTGMDITPELLAYGEGLARQAGLAGRITFKQGDMTHLPFPDASFDWAWSADSVGYPARDALPAINELARVVRPGGRIFVLAWTSQQVLPGYPLLEARLNDLCSAYAPYLAVSSPDEHFLRLPVVFRRAGLRAVEAHTFVGEAHAPLTGEIRAALVGLLGMLWTPSAEKLAADEWAAYQYLCLPESPEFIVDQPGYYAFFTYTLFYGDCPGGVGNWKR